VGSVASPPAPRPRPSPRRIAAAAAAWVAMTAAVVALAVRLDRPADVAAPDAARPEVGAVALPGGAADPEGLPPLAIVLGGAPPVDLAGLAPDAQVRSLRREAALGADPRVLLALGALNQRLDRRPAARAAFRDVLTLDPDNVAARVGLALELGAGGGPGLERAARELTALSRANPASQVVSFNRGWLAVYRRDARTAVAAWRRTVEQGAETPLGRTARRLLTSVSEPQGGAGP
jgi:hypothetical protein